MKVLALVLHSAHRGRDFAVISGNWAAGEGVPAPNPLFVALAYPRRARSRRTEMLEGRIDF